MAAPPTPAIATRRTSNPQLLVVMASPRSVLCPMTRNMTSPRAKTTTTTTMTLILPTPVVERSSYPTTRTTKKSRAKKKTPLLVAASAVPATRRPSFALRRKKPKLAKLPRAPKLPRSNASRRRARSQCHSRTQFLPPGMSSSPSKRRLCSSAIVASQARRPTQRSLAAPRSPPADVLMSAPRIFDT
ncbi:hypothetical protein DFH06DRAFT_400007 [Mycena polygramma]|nr:hypothetical protein DFH06DRAFT_400007 [Mycena polygramma]